MTALSCHLPKTCTKSPRTSCPSTCTFPPFFDVDVCSCPSRRGKWAQGAEEPVVGAKNARAGDILGTQCRALTYPLCVSPCTMQACSKVVVHALTAPQESPKATASPPHLAGHRVSRPPILRIGEQFCAQRCPAVLFCAPRCPAGESD